MAWIWSRPGLLLPGVLALPSSGCLCDCGGNLGNSVSVSSSTPMSGLDVSGDGCGEATCSSPETSGACRQFMVTLVHAGSCHLTATATDGRQAAIDVTVTVDHTNCCGNFYKAGSNGQSTGEITFSGAGSDGGA